MCPRPPLQVAAHSRRRAPVERRPAQHRMCPWPPVQAAANSGPQARVECRPAQAAFPGRRSAHRPKGWIAATAAIPSRTIGRRKANGTPTKTRRSIAGRIAEAIFCRKLSRAPPHEDLHRVVVVTNSSLVKRPDGRFGHLLRNAAGASAQRALAKDLFAPSTFCHVFTHLSPCLFLQYNLGSVWVTWRAEGPSGSPCSKGSTPRKPSRTEPTSFDQANRAPSGCEPRSRATAGRAAHACLLDPYG
jgi:hypothetical protein